SGVRGTIVRVAVRNVWIRTKEGDIAVIGNSNLKSGPLVNYTATRRIDARLEAGQNELNALERLIEARRRKDKPAAKKAEAEVELAKAAVKQVESEDPPAAPAGPRP
ncbi:MAG: mechanosensitive ion channel domain-containing protein, partial [Thermoplasmata archaeon]